MGMEFEFTEYRFEHIYSDARAKFDSDSSSPLAQGLGSENAV